MKRYFFYFLLIIATYQCNNDDDRHISEIDKLPPITQSGANTFGCLLDGKAHTPDHLSTSLNCYYQYLDGEYYFLVAASRRNSMWDLIDISLRTEALEIEEGQSYQLLEHVPGNFIGGYGYEGHFLYTSSGQTGEITITKLDHINGIVCGTFFFDIVDSNGVLHQVREGRFDMLFTN